ncbi:MAG: DNA-directed RNA polymerase core subunit rpc40 [Vezdaea aestivalis]|nr:MAG: DNA-directed RNA polymerase core subunit rpc40 [Vezdaea aestivalis]
MAPGFPYRIPSEDEVAHRNIVGINEETVTDVTSRNFPHHYNAEDHAWDLNEFRNSFTVKVHTNPNPLELTFSLIGLDASVANAFRRILISEISTLAIESCFIHQNTSIVQDEVLANRLGLVPLKGNREGLRQMQWFQRATEENPIASDPTDGNTVILKLQVECTAKAGVKKGETDPLELFNNPHVYAKHFRYEATGNQEQYFSGNGAIKPVYPDILLAKMRPGQAIDIEVHCIKGIGADHAKFSPVATATYRLLPVINILKPITGEDAKKFAQCFPPGVIDLVRLSEAEKEAKEVNVSDQNEDIKAVVKDPMRDTVSRECLRHQEFRGKVKLGRQRDHFIYSIESTGQFDSDELFEDSVKILALKCRIMKRNLGRIYYQ